MPDLTKSAPLPRRLSPSSVRGAIAALSTIALTLSLAACGGSASTTNSTTHQAASVAGATTTGETTTPKKPASATGVYTRPMRATLVGEDHAPKVNRAWSYAVSVTDAKGHALSGTVDIEFAMSGTVVGHDVPPTRPVTGGNLHRTMRFPAQAVGVPLDFQAVVHTTLGSLTLDWPITVKQ